MPPLELSIRHTMIAVICAMAVSCVRAELLKVSPFLGPQSAANTPTQNAPLEYRGSMAIGEVLEFRVVDPARKVGTWLKVGEQDANLDVTLKEHNDTQDTITVEHAGQTSTLQLKMPKVVSSGAMPAPPVMPLAPTAPNVSPAVIQTVVPNPTPQQEQERLQAVAAEVARRRALREQAIRQAETQGQGGAPQMPMPPPVNASRADLMQAQQLMQQQQQRR